MDLRIDRAEPSDLADIVELYNHHIESTPVTFHTQAFTVEGRRAWFDSHAAEGKHQLFAARQGTSFVGFANSSPYGDRQAFTTSVSLSIYLKDAVTGRGVGTALYGTLIDAVRAAGAHRAYGGVTLPNSASNRLHEKLGFVDVGTLHEVGKKFGRFWSVRLYELAL